MLLLAQKAYREQLLLPQPLQCSHFLGPFLFQHFRAHRCLVPDWGPDWEGWYPDGHPTGTSVPLS